MSWEGYPLSIQFLWGKLRWRPAWCIPTIDQASVILVLTPFRQHKRYCNTRDVRMDFLNKLRNEGATSLHKHWIPSDEHWKDRWSSVQPKLGGQHSGPLIQQCRGMGLFSGRPWLKRVWVLQEVANSKKAEVYCGANHSHKLLLIRPFAN